MAGVIIAAAVTPDNTPGGSVLTFAVPVGLFAVVAVILYLLFSRPHRRIPARGVQPGGTAAPHPDAARAASIAGGLAVAAGAGAAETHLEPAGPVYAAEAGAGPGPGVAPEQVPGSDDAEQPSGEGATAEGTEDGQ
jgi:hypothetical protein